MSMAFEISTDDIESVLGEDPQRVINPLGLSIAALADQLIAEIDDGRIEEAALQSCDFGEQVAYAYEEIRLNLIELGALAA